MDCLQCGGTYTENPGTYLLVDPYVGEIIVQGVSYHQCDDCGNILLSREMAQEIESERSKRIHEILNRFPIGNFISSSETASMLDISRQALHKNRRINHGFIYHIKFGPTTFYLRQSVHNYKKFGDGRFPLHLHRRMSPTEYLARSTPSKTPAVYEVSQLSIKSTHSFIKHKNVTPKEYIYAS